jgi:uncharacterized protein (TIGR02266 family)
MGSLTLVDAGRRALVELAHRVAAIPDDAIARPHTDPHAAAVTGVLVADYLAQGTFASPLEEAGTSVEAATDLGKVARALLVLVEDLGGDYLTDAKDVPGDLVQRGEGVRSVVLDALERAFHTDLSVVQWVEAIKLGSGVVDLVYDLRTVADLAHARFAEAAPDVRDAHAEAAGAIEKAREAAAALEFALREGESAEHARLRGTIGRLWTMFVPAYEKAAAAGRTLTRSDGKERQFPPLALVASHRRAQSRPLSLVPGRASAPPAATGDVVGAGAGPGGDDVRVLRSEPPPALDTAVSASVAADVRAHAEHEDRQSWSESRRRQRQTVEIEVGISSESNFFVGFTENLSEGGVFVATYARKPIGAHVDVVLTFPNGASIQVPGVVRWLRDASSEGWPGMGVQFEQLSPEDEKNIRKFLSLREPMFYDV